MIVIVDMGATKTDWSFADGSTVIKTIQTKGFNPYFYSTGEIIEILRTNFIKEDFTEVKKVYLYGAGCSTQEKKSIVENALKFYFPLAKIDINHDLLASARAICGKNPGIACILGTGSNSCLYDGTDVIANNPSLGFILGDEGSGGDLGRELIKSYYYGELSKQVENKFESQFHTDRDSLLANVYSTSEPNTYCAAFAPFLVQNINEDCVKKLVVGSFNQFFERHVSTYDNYKRLPINFVGSVAHHFKNILEEVAKSHGCRIGLIVKAPVGKLIEYHYKYDV